MKIKKLLTALFFSLTLASSCVAASFASGKSQEASVTHAATIPTVTFTNSDMGFKTIKSGTGPFKGYQRLIQEGENLNFDEVVKDGSGKPTYETVDDYNKPFTSNEKCTSHIKSGYLKFNISIRGANNVKVRFIFKIANYNGGWGVNFYSIQVGSKSATKYYPNGQLQSGAGTSYSYWRWAECPVEHDFWLGSGTTTVYLSPGNTNNFCNLDCIYIDLVGDDQPVLSSLSTYTLEGEYLDVTNWAERSDMITADKNSFLEAPSQSLTPATSNLLSIARFTGNTTFTLRFSANASATFSLGLVLAYYDVTDFNDKILIKLDGNDMPNPQPGSVGGHTAGNQYYYWQTANLGTYSVESGSHTLAVTMVDVAPNIDCFKFTVTKYDGVGVDQIVDETPTAAVTGGTYGTSKLIITDANSTPTRGYDSLKGPSFTTTRLLITLTDEVTYYTGNVIGVNTSCASGKAVLNVYCGSTKLGTQTLSTSPYEYTYSLSSGNSGYIQIEIIGDGEEALYVKWINIYGYTTGNTFDDTDLLTFGTTLNTCLTCNGSARTYTEETWNSVSTAYSNLDDTYQRMVTAYPANESGNALAQGLARYDYIIAKYAGKDYTSDFLGREATADVEYGSLFATSRYFYLSADSSFEIIAVAVIVLVTVGSMAIVFRRRKRHL